MNTQNVIISPSILSANFAHLERDIRGIEEGGAEWVHIDVMDGHFVPNITYGPLIVKTLRSITGLALDVHLMIENPDRYIGAFADAGADIITVHAETCPHLHRTVQNIHGCGKKAGVSLNPSTGLYAVDEILPDIDLLLIMSVNPGFGGQKFIPSSLDKIRRAAAKISELRTDTIIEIDGGVDETNAKIIVDAGCTALVSGTGVFKHENRAEGVRLLRKAAQGE